MPCKPICGALAAAALLLCACQKHPQQLLPVLSTANTTKAVGPRPVQKSAFYVNDFSRAPNVSEMTAIGERLFNDRALSASGKLACSTCHDPSAAYGPADSQPVRHGGLGGEISGTRAVPSLKYVQNVPPFSEHYFDEAVDESVDQGPVGGHTWDGRADTVHDQARLPLFSAAEMANSSEHDVVAKVSQAEYAPAMQAAFGDDVFANEERAFKAVLMSLEVFQQDPKRFYPFDSKYDAWLRGQTRLSARELRGLKAFADPDKGNCASCHPSQVRQGAFPQFTDFGLIAVGVPRNAAIPANKDAAYFDLGVCGPIRIDLQGRPEYCGLFRTPSLRNVALRHVYFHNGAFSSLRRVVEFYAQRDTEPEKFYPRRADGSIAKFDDLPLQYQKNINTERPFGGERGSKPALTAVEIGDLVAFLQTLNDGFQIKMCAGRRDCTN